MIPSPKDPKLEADLEEMFGRSTAILTNHCIPVPVGCGQPITKFSNPLYEREYKISGLCEACQHLAFDPRPDDPVYWKRKSPPKQLNFKQPEVELLNWRHK